MPDYSLQLADGFRLAFSSTRDRTSWLQQFAGTLTLPAVEASSPAERESARIRICAETEIGLEIDRLWGDQQPTRFDLGPLEVFSVRGSSDLLFVTPEDTDRHSWLMSMWYSLYPLYPRLLKHGILPIHAGLAVWNDSGVLFAAPGGTGKSTTMRRLPPPWRTLGDDESWLVQTETGLRAHPLPTWSDLVLRGKSDRWPSSSSLPVKHVVFLRQADHVSIQPLSHAEAAAYLNQAVEQILRRAWTILVPPDLAAVKARMFELASERAQQLTCFLVDLNLDDPFADPLQDAIAATG